MYDRVHYIHMPTDYATSLQENGERPKARAFFEYFHDMKRKNINSLSFYAKSWGISKASSGRWVAEFKEEIHKFFELWNVKNDENCVRRFSKSNETTKAHESPINRGLKKTHETIFKNTRDQVNNKIKDNNSAHACVSDYDRDFEMLFTMAKYSYEFIGKRKEAYKEYQRHYPHIQPKEMAHAYSLHVNDKDLFKKPYNLANFMLNDVYASYLCPRIKVIKDDAQILEGWYDKEVDQLVTATKKWQLTKERFTELLCKGDIEILPQMTTPGAYA